jgi:hypothetical protein
MVARLRVEKKMQNEVFSETAAEGVAPDPPPHGKGDVGLALHQCGNGVERYIEVNGDVERVGGRWS